VDVGAGFGDVQGRPQRDPFQRRAAGGGGAVRAAAGVGRGNWLDTRRSGVRRRLPAAVVAGPAISWPHAYLDVEEEHRGYTGEFTAPLLLAASAHAFLDGWGLASAGHSEAVSVVFPVAVMLHKAPEGLALGAIFRASTGSRGKAFGLCFVAEAATFVGGWAGAVLTPKLGSAWTNYPLAIAGGCFLYLGYHAIEGEWRRYGLRAVWLPAVIGFAGAAAVQSGIWKLGR
jgi:zinc transporter ZupT